MSFLFWWSTKKKGKLDYSFIFLESVLLQINYKNTEVGRTLQILPTIYNSILLWF